MKNINVLFSVIMSIALVGCAAGGGSGNVSGSTKPSSATSGAVVSAVSGSMSNKLLANTNTSMELKGNSSQSGRSFEDAHKQILDRIVNERVQGMSAQDIFDKAMSDSATVTLSGSYTCLGGGSIAIDGTMTFNLNSSGPSDFTLDYSMGMDETMTACKEGEYTINGDIGVHTATGQFNVSVTDPVENSTFGASYHYPISGTVDITGPESYTGCVIDVTSNMIMNGSFHTSMTYSSSTTGSVCGSSINESYSYTYTAD